MANEEHLKILKQGTTAWNQWRMENPGVQPDLRGAYLSMADLSGANLDRTLFSRANLSHAKLTKASLIEAVLVRTDLIMADLAFADLRRALLGGAVLQYANLGEAKLSEAGLSGADFYRANLEGANLTKANLNNAHLTGACLKRAKLKRASLYQAVLNFANLNGADLSEAYLFRTSLDSAELSEANLEGADLTKASLIKTDLKGVNLRTCKVYGISAWGVKLQNAKQENLIITHPDEPTITVDNLEVAQFIYLLLNNEKIRDIIETITSKVVLILGRFTSERKAVLDAIRNQLRKRDYLPVLFDFDKPASRDLTETISLLARMARFVIADVTEPRSVPQQLMSFIPDFPSVPVQPLLLASAEEYGMFEHFKRYPWVLPIHRYKDLDDLLKSLPEKVIAPIEAKAMEFQKKR